VSDAKAARMVRVIFQRTFPAVSHYTSCNHLENPGEKEPSNEFIKESPGVRRVVGRKL